MDEAASAPRRWRRWGVELAVVAAVFLAVAAWQGRDMVAGAAPELAGTTLDGAAFDLRAQRGQSVVVHFWASWCPVCRVQEGNIAALAADPGQRVMTVAMQSGSDAELRAFLRDRGAAFPVINDPAGELAARWGVRGVPATFIINPAGAIRFREAGYTTGLGLRLRAWLAGL